VLDVKATHVGGLLSRPLHTRRVAVQVQVVRILDFCLSTRPEPLIKIHASFVGLLQEALSLAENDDAATAAAKTGVAPGAGDDMHALRAACIRLMCSAMACPELKTPPRARSSSRSCASGSSPCSSSRSPAATPTWWTSPSAA
jgi:transformation/transcription domain-associated protein